MTLLLLFCVTLLLPVLVETIFIRSAKYMHNRSTVMGLSLSHAVVLNDFMLLLLLCFTLLQEFSHANDPMLFSPSCFTLLQEFSHANDPMLFSSPCFTLLQEFSHANDPMLFSSSCFTLLQEFSHAGILQ